MDTLVIKGQRLTIEDVVDVARRGRKVQLHARAAKHTDHRFTDLGKETVYKACDEKLNGRHGCIVVQKPVV